MGGGESATEVLDDEGTRRRRREGGVEEELGRDMTVDHTVVLLYSSRRNPKCRATALPGHGRKRAGTTTSSKFKVRDIHRAIHGQEKRLVSMLKNRQALM